MPKKTTDETPAPAPKKLTVTDMLSALGDAYDVAEDKQEELAKAHAAQTKAVAEAQAVFDAVKADYQSRVQAAAQAADDARQALETLRAAVNERVGTLTGQPTDPRVSVR